MRRLLRVCAWIGMLLCAAAAQAQSTYGADSSAAAASAYPWIDISATGSTLGLNDNAVSGAIALGFTFTYGSTAYTQVRVSSNGMLQFASTSTANVSSALPLDGTSGKPNIDAVMAPLWDDLNPGNTSSYLRYATQGSAPNRVFVVSWLAVPYYCANTNPSVCNPAKNQTKNAFATFQVQIYEQGQFVYRCQSVNGAGGTHTGGAAFTNMAGASIGYEVGNADYVSYSFDSASVPSGTTILWTRRLSAPGLFNTFETSTASGQISGVIKTKVAGSPFTLAVVALNAAKTAVQTTFTGTVKVELLDASDSSGALDSSSGCRASWGVIAGSTVQTLTFASADLGRKNLSFTESNAWRNARVRVSYPATGTATVIGCSTDNFAIRPASLANPFAKDADAQTAGTARSLNNVASSGGNVHKAGQPFTVGATATNASGATTTNYNGTPTATLSACSGSACIGSLGSLSLTAAAVSGVITDNTATYSEAGAFRLQLDDASFASVDSGDGSTAAEMTVSSPALDIGRFVPDHFTLTLLATPQLKTFNDVSCSTRSFTYVGQPFSYLSAPQAVVAAENADGDTTANYQGVLWKLSGSAVSQAYSPIAPASPALDTSSISNAGVTSNGDGTGVIAAAGTDTLKYTRSSSTPLAPFNASISLSWSASDTSESAVAGNGSIATTTPLVFSSIAFDSGNAFRYGVLKLASAYGSELNNLAVGVEAQYWDGLRFATNTSDQCTSLPTGIVAMGNYQRSLSACETALAPATQKLSAGRGFFALLKPGSGNNGSTDLTLQLGATASGQTCTAVGAAAVAASAGNLSWLQGKWNGAASYTANPSSRASFGQYKSPLIYLRESF